VAALLFVLCPAGARAQSVVGHGKVEIGGQKQVFAQVSVDAWVDADGVAQGWMLVTASAEQLFGEHGPYVVVIAVADISISIGQAGEAQVFGFIVSPAVSFGGDIIASFRFDPATGLAETFDEEGSLNLHGDIDAGKIIVGD
jgi:hypothetical protein